MSQNGLNKLIDAVVEANMAGGGNIQGTSAPLGDPEEVLDDNEKEKEESKLKGAPLTEDELVEQRLRKYIRSKLIKSLRQHKARIIKEEKALRKIIRELISEGDVSDMHPNRSTGINTLEDLLKKVVPTLRTDYKRLTTDKAQRDSFRAHMLKAIKDSLLPSIINAVPPDQGSTMLATPEGDELAADDADNQELEDIEDTEGLFEEFKMLDEIEVDIEDDAGPADKEKMIPVEDDDQPTEEEAFGIEGEDVTGRNMAFATNKKIQQYILDAFDSLGNPDDRKVFIDYLITNVKLYFDKFEDELQTVVDEPTTPEYEDAKEETDAAEGGI